MLAATTVTLSAVGGLIAGIRMFTDAPAQRLGIVALVALLVLLTISPTIACGPPASAHRGLGSNVTGRDLFRRNDGMPIDVVVPVDDDSDEDTEPDRTPSGARIADAARRANGVLTGICAGSAIALPTAIWATVTAAGAGTRRRDGNPRSAVHAHLHQRGAGLLRPAAGGGAGMRRRCGLLRGSGATGNSAGRRGRRTSGVRRCGPGLTWRCRPPVPPLVRMTVE